ncbi:MAG: response regulator transcription factor [Cyanobacteria bacterium K_DeepCast_0m_m1_088]|nr:response regulator transcription factor [Cyanobacteria bacterium K_DeepCast_0m_m1_088]
MAIQWNDGSHGAIERSIAEVVLPGKLLIAGRSRAFAYLFAFATYSIAPEGLLGAATNRRELLGLLGEATGEVFVVLHDEMLDHYGEGLLDEIRTAKTGISVIVLSSQEATTVEACTGLLKADAVIAEQNIGKGVLIPAIQAIRAGNTPHVDPLLRTIYAQEIQGQRDVKPRERDILMLVASGLTNKEIAAQLFIAETTTRDYVSELIQRFEVANRAALAAAAIQLGYGRAPLEVNPE